MLGVGVGDDHRRGDSGPVDELDAGHPIPRRRDLDDVRREADLGARRGGHPEQRLAAVRRDRHAVYQQPKRDSMWGMQASVAGARYGDDPE